MPRRITKKLLHFRGSLSCASACLCTSVEHECLVTLFETLTRRQKSLQLSNRIKSNTVAVYYWGVPWFWEANRHDTTTTRQEEEMVEQDNDEEEAGRQRKRNTRAFSPSALLSLRCYRASTLISRRLHGVKPARFSSSSPTCRRNIWNENDTILPKPS